MMIKIKYGTNPQGIKEFEVTPLKKDPLIQFMKNFLAKEEETKYQPSKWVNQKHRKVAIPPRPWPKKEVTTPLKPKMKKVWRKKVQPPISSSPNTDAALKS